MPRTTATKKKLTGVHLWLLLWKATKAKESFARRSVESLGLCLSDFGALEVLLHKGPLPVDTLRKKILISSGSMTAAVDRLERQQLVQRRDSATDRRARIAHLTAKGTKLIERLFAAHTEDMERAFSSLNQEERESLAALLHKIASVHETVRETVLKTQGPATDGTLASRKRE